MRPLITHRFDLKIKDVVRTIARDDLRVRCLQRIGRRGLSSARIEGMPAASAPTIAVMDADLQHMGAIANVGIATYVFTNRTQ